ncbi:MAG TPA: TIGR04283 family arsenosugar biosynthesis glycosyltransferase [Acidobacteriaceae bacterium]|nr:TIGR04283 family arsenosugar biosynthesis glycosyltransferase [Acidobacteriaceae bacterium]
MRISVIIPVLNEREDLPQTLHALAEFPNIHEVIVVDGGSSDGTREWLSTNLPANGLVIDGARGRGNQLNAGARAATGEALLFLHADTRLPENAIQQITDALAEPDVIGGGFYLHFLESKPWTLNVVSSGINFRTRLLRRSTGDQAIFSRRDSFVAAGGFTQWPIFEDVDFVQRLKRLGRFAIIPSHVATSARRYITWGVLRTVFLMFALQIGYRMGISPFRLHRWYRDVRFNPVLDPKYETPQPTKQRP